jgi:hypothetical protein
MRYTTMAVAAALAAVSGVAWAQPRVALVAAAGGSLQFNDVQAKLQGTGAFSAVDIIDVQLTTPSLATLQTYDAVMTWTNTTPQSAAALGDVLADYVDAGGGVVVTVFANSSITTNRRLEGRWRTGDYEVVVPATGSTTGRATLGSILVPGHPIMNGVSTFDGGTSSFRPTGTAVCAACTKVALWSDSRTLVAVHNTRANRADLGMYPPSSDASTSWWVSSTDGARLMANALLYVIGPTCRVDFNSDGELTFDDIQLFVQLYNASDPRADLNNDQEWTFDDIQLFISLYNAGC